MIALNSMPNIEEALRIRTKLKQIQNINFPYRIQDLYFLIQNRDGLCNDYIFSLNIDLSLANRVRQFIADELKKDLNKLGYRL